MPDLAERRRTRLLIAVVTIPALLFAGVVAGLWAVRKQHEPVRWSTVNRGCPVLAPMTATLLQLGDDGRQQSPDAERGVCHYTGRHTELTVTVILYFGEMTRSGHDLAVDAIRDAPPRFRQLGPQPVDGRFGTIGEALALDLVQDNATIETRYAGPGDGAQLRSSVQVVANQVIDTLG